MPRSTAAGLGARGSGRRSDGPPGAQGAEPPDAAGLSDSSSGGSPLLFGSRRAAPRADSASDSSPEPRPRSLRAALQLLRRRRRRRRPKRAGGPRGRPRGSGGGRRGSAIRRRQIQDKAAGCPSSEPGRAAGPWRKILAFEQAVSRGFFNYLERLKYEHHLKESLKQMNVGEDLEKDDLDSRRYKYLDDDGSLSPIEESGTEDLNDVENGCDIKLVEESHFIIRSELPRRTKVYLEQECVRGEPALSKKRSSKLKH